MNRPIEFGRINDIIIAVVLGISGTAFAEDAKLEPWGKSNQNFGMDNTTFRAQFGPAFHPNRPPSASLTIEEIADQVSEIRVFLTPDASMVVGEIAITGDPKDHSSSELQRRLKGPA